jgi:hypothetical protein
MGQTKDVPVLEISANAPISVLIGVMRGTVVSIC